VREGGSSGSGVETAEKSTFGSRLDMRETEERWWCRCGFGCRRVFASLFHSGNEVENGRIDDEIRATKNVVARISYALHGPPTSWVPPHVSPSPTSLPIDKEPPTSR